MIIDVSSLLVPSWDVDRVSGIYGAAADWLKSPTLILLAVMAAHVLITACHWFYQHRIAHRQTCAFARDTATAIGGGRFREVVARTTRNSRRPGSRTSLPRASALSVPFRRNCRIQRPSPHSPERSFERARKVLAAGQRIGLNKLSSIATCASLIRASGHLFRRSLCACRSRDGEAPLDNFGDLGPC